MTTGRESSSSSAPEAPTAPAPAPPSRAVGHAQVCVLLILGVGFLLVFSYQSEIHTVTLGGEGLGGRHVYASASVAAAAAARSTGEPVVKRPIWNVARDSGSGDGKEAEVEKEMGSAGKVVARSSVAQRRLESENAANSSSSTEAVSASASASSPAKKVDWKDMKIEAYRPLVDSVENNIVSSNFQLVIKVLALNDYSNISRCLGSLAKAEYAGDEIDLHIYIDHFEISGSEERRRSLLAAEEEEENTGAEVRKGSEKRSAVISNSKAERIKRMKERNKANKASRSAVTSRSLKGDDDVDDAKPKPAQLPDRVETGVESVNPSDWGLVEERLAEARKVLNHVESFQWKHGKKVIHYRTRTAGSQTQWLDAWWPSSDDEFALFVEDDAELSPLFYRYARALIATYYYQPSHYDRSLYGISLQRPQIVPGKNGQPLKVDDRTRLFKYQMVGIWGQIFFPKPWKEFREWYDKKKSHDVKPVVDGMVTTDWYKEHGEKMITPWFVKFAYNRGYFNMYTNFLRDRVLSVTHRDIGGKPKKYAGCDSVLLWANGTYDLDLWHMEANWHIKRYDYCFKEVSVGRFANHLSDAKWVLNSASKGNKQILMVSTVGVPEVLVRNWLCKLRKLGIENHVLVGEDAALLDDLARRGHATMRIESKRNLTTSIEKEVSVVSDVLKLGYDVWFTRADAIWVGNPLTLVNTEGADVIGVENSQLNLFYIRSTEETTPLWGSANEELSKVQANVSIAGNWERAREKFIKSCEEKEKIQIRKLDQVVFIDGEKLSQPPTLENSGGGSADAQVVVLSGYRSQGDYKIKAKASQLGLWNLDDDLACATLIC